MPLNTNFKIGLFGIVPSSQPGRDGPTLIAFRKQLSDIVSKEIANNREFPTDRKLYVFLMQYLLSEEKYNRHDVDNMAKTVLDILKGKICNDDGQVIVLLAAKRIADHRVNQDFAYIEVKTIRDGATNEVLRAGGAENAITFFQQSKTSAGSATSS